MKVLDLHCREHVFEGWFASEEDFQSQLGKGWFSALCVGMTRYKNASVLRA
jgi:hypothetical protein